jgi:hypothetical protein
MASSGGDRGKLLTAGGILSIVTGILEVIGGVSMVVLRDLELLFFWLPLVSGLDVWGEHIGDLAQPPPPPPIWPLIMIGFGLVVLGIFAIIGGISAIRRKSFGVSLAGAVCALPSVILGILAVIFVALGKREFGEKG